MKIPVSVEVLTRNNAATIERCLRSVADCDDVMVLDGGSTDGTREIAEGRGARVLDQKEGQKENEPIADFAAVRNRGLAAARHEWFLYLDSDEYLSTEVLEEIRGIIEHGNPPAHIWRMPRVYVHGGEIIDCSLGYPNYQTRFFHRGHAEQFIKGVHERIEVRSGERILPLRHPTYVPLMSVAELRVKADGYVAIEEERIRVLGRAVIARKIIHTMGVIGRNIFHIRRVISCRGRRLPFLYEWLRFEYHLKLVAMLAKKFFTPKKT